MESDLIELTLTIKLPTYDTFFVTILLSDDYILNIRDLKYKIFEKGHGIHPSRMRLIFNFTELQDHIAIRDTEIDDGDTLEIVFKVFDVAELDGFFYYDEFVLGVNPVDGMLNVPIDTTVTVTLMHNKHNQIIYTPALENYNNLLTLYDGDMPKHFRNREEAVSSGFVKWCNDDIKERIMLIQIDDQLDLRLERVRYNIHGVNQGYYKGDKYSWQRYTKSLPIECKITVRSALCEEMEEELAIIEHSREIEKTNKDLHENSISFSSFSQADKLLGLDKKIDDTGWVHIDLKPFQPLKFNSCYALLLCNNVPTVPRKGPILDPQARLMAYNGNGMGEDKLYIFKTVKEQLY